MKVLKEKAESNNVYFEKLNEENESLKDQVIKSEFKSSNFKSFNLYLG